MDAGANTGWRGHARGAAIGFALALLYGLMLYGLAKAMTPGMPAFEVLLLLVPFFAPSLAIAMIDPEGRQSRGRHALTGFAVALLMLLAGVVMLNEGGVCTVMAAPFFLIIAPFGAMWSGNNRRAARLRGEAGITLRSVAWLALPAVAMPLQQQFPLPLPLADTVVTSTVVVAAPPAAVWNQLIEVRHIRQRELGWTFSQDVAGVPKPTDARLDRHGVGGVRHVHWGPGVAFDEVVTRWQPGRDLAWRFAFPAGGFGKAFDEHINPDSDYLKVADGSYRLDPLPGGRTRLTLTTHYRVRTAINAYCDLWGRVFVGDFHTNVLRVIKGRSETSPA